MKENFSFELFSNPKKFFTDILKNLLVFIVKTIVIGSIIYVVMSKVGLKNNRSIVNYIKYFLIGSVVLYLLSMLNMIYDCYNSGTKFDKMNFKKFALSSMFAPSFVLFHIILLIVCGYLEVAPEIGVLIYLISWTTLGIVVGTGVAYNLVYDGVNHFVKC